MKTFTKNYSGWLLSFSIACACFASPLNAAVDVYNDNSGSHGSQNSAKVGVDNSGKTTAVWQATNLLGNTVIQASTKSPGQTLWIANTPDPISGNGGVGTTLQASSPILAVNTNGFAVAVWQVYDSSLSTILVYSATRAPGSNVWNNLTRLSTTTEEAFGDYAVVVDNTAGPRITVTWSSYVHSTDTFTRIRSASSNDGGQSWF